MSREQFLNNTGRCACCEDSMYPKGVFQGGQSEAGLLYCSLCSVHLNNQQSEKIRFCKGFERTKSMDSRVLYFQCALLSVEIGDEDGAVEYLHEAGLGHITLGLLSMAAANIYNIITSR